MHCFSMISPNPTECPQKKHRAMCFWFILTGFSVFETSIYPLTTSANTALLLEGELQVGLPASTARRGTFPQICSTDIIQLGDTQGATILPMSFFPSFIEKANTNSSGSVLPWQGFVQPSTQPTNWEIWKVLKEKPKSIGMNQNQSTFKHVWSKHKHQPYW